MIYISKQFDEMINGMRSVIKSAEAWSVHYEQMLADKPWACGTDSLEIHYAFEDYYHELDELSDIGYRYLQTISNEAEYNLVDYELQDTENYYYSMLQKARYKAMRAWEIAVDKLWESEEESKSSDDDKDDDNHNEHSNNDEYDDDYNDYAYRATLICDDEW